MKVALQRFLASRKAIWVAIGLGLLLVTPSLTVGLVADDWLQLLVARGLRPFAGLPASRLDLFSFAGHDPATIQPLVDAGLFPWWTDPSVKLAFWRPLASLTHLADWTLWPNAAWAMHLHNLAWFGLALAATAAVYRRFLDGWSVGLATLLYAIDDAHGPAVGWVANRNAMVAVAFALPVLLLHDRWRRQAWRAGAVVAPVWLGVALLAGESSIAVVGYVAAYALCLDRSPWRARLASLAPYLVVVVVWRVVYHALGYGTAHSGVYLDPGSDPAAFLRALPSRAAFLLTGQLALPWSDLASLYPFISAHAARVMLLAAFATVALLAALFAPLCRRDPVARFFALGALLSVVPIASTFPADRLLWFVGVGAMGLLARWLAAGPRGVVPVAAASLMILVHLVLPLVALPVRSRSMDAVRTPLMRANASLPPSSALAGKTLIAINPPSDFFLGYLVLLRAAEGAPLPRARWLATGTSAVRVTRQDDRTLLVRPDNGYLAYVSERMLRDLRRPFTRGDEVRLTGVTITITDVLPDGRPAEIRARFDRPLEDPTLVFVKWGTTGYVPFVPPPINTPVTLTAISFLEAVFGK
ncbi:MAG: hypothetical protein JWN44_2712 [Myxococcales bacterium]|nr:hypothetical protein [Myxococcales bacterium]